MGKVKVSDAISIQPFWNAEKKQQRLMHRSLTGEAIAIIYDIALYGKGLRCVPGIGLIGISFSLDPEYPQAACCGVLERPKDVPMSGVEKTFLCHLFPGEFTRIFGIPSRLLTNREIPLSDLLPLDSYVREIAQSPDFDSRMEIMGRLIRQCERQRSSRNNQPLGQDVAQMILDTHGDTRMKELESQTGYSSRYLQKLLNEHIGFSPKRMASNVRIQTVLYTIYSNPHRPLAEIAQQCGFYDQSHFNRVFKENVGLCPSEFLSQIQARPIPVKRNA